VFVHAMLVQRARAHILKAFIFHVIIRAIRNGLHFTRALVQFSSSCVAFVKDS